MMAGADASLRNEMRRLAVLFFTATALFGQQPVDLLNRIAQHAARLEPMLQQVRAKEWVAKGAADTYVTQLSSARSQIQGIVDSMSTLAQHPDRTQDCLRA